VEREARRTGEQCGSSEAGAAVCLGSPSGVGPSVVLKGGWEGGAAGGHDPRRERQGA
jgi:hypothetical protein